MLRSALLLLLLLVPTVLAAPVSTGPWSGSVRQGEIDGHDFQNNPSGFACPVYPWGSARRYVVTLEYAPPTDTLVLRYAGQQIVGKNGLATYAYDGSSCQARSFGVEGRAVADEAHYVVHIVQGGPPSSWTLCNDRIC